MLQSESESQQSKTKLAMTRETSDCFMAESSPNGRHFI